MRKKDYQVEKAKERNDKFNEGYDFYEKDRFSNVANKNNRGKK